MPKVKKKTIKKTQKVTTSVKQDKKKKYFYASGSRKRARARIRLYKGKGNIIINNKKAEEYLTNNLLDKVIKEPLLLTNTKDKFDISVKVTGGGKCGQAEAMRHGISRALVVYDQELKPTLKKAGYLTRDPREKERKKYGLKRARKAPQYRKR
jgi:small subunit ribosomal protein S9